VLVENLTNPAHVGETAADSSAECVWTRARSCWLS
jgi:hypothetical protein